LGQGVLQDVLGKVLPANLNKSANATKTGDNDTVEATPTGLPTDSLPIINMGLGKLTAAIPSATKVTSDGTLASVSTSLQGLLNTAAAEKTGGTALSNASSSLASINVLNLLKVGVINLKSHSEAGGLPGTAKNTHSCSIANVNLANGAGALALDGKSLTIGGV